MMTLVKAPFRLPEYRLVLGDTVLRALGMSC